MNTIYYWLYEFKRSRANTYAHRANTVRSMEISSEGFIIKMHSILMKERRVKDHEHVEAIKSKMAQEGGGVSLP